MYSIFLPFAAVVVDLCVAYIYFKVEKSFEKKHESHLNTYLKVYIDIDGRVIFRQSNCKTDLIVAMEAQWWLYRLITIIITIISIITIKIVTIITLVTITIISSMIGGLEEARLP